jgi:hypothetical protein
LRPPGLLDELDEAGRVAWDEVVARSVDAVAADGGPGFIGAADSRTPALTGPDWTGLPARIAARLGRARALRELDRDRSEQEEYVEWRAVREGGAIRRVELTTELRDYWWVLAAHRPERTIELVGELTGVSVDPRRLYGVADPSALEPGRRADAFREAIEGRARALNDGRRGICFMSHRSNDLGSLALIAAAATRPFAVRGAGARGRRPASAAEVIPHLGGAAMAGRASDPVIVERLGRLAWERRLVALDDPLGVYIEGVEAGRLRTPGDEPVPPEWFRPGRGAPAARVPDGRARHQRLTLEVPRGERLAVSDLVDAATEQPIRHGGQVADLVQLRLNLRVGEPGSAPASAPVTIPAGGGRR